MIDFWLAIGLMLLVAMSFLLLPVLRERRAQSEEDRTALNVALYQERLDELQGQVATGLLSPAQMDSARAEAGRELLADTDGTPPAPRRRLGKGLPFCAALLVPLLGLGLYLHWGASDKVELAREFAVAPSSLAQMTARLERAAAAQPDSAEGWYFLGRSYMAGNRFGDAQQAFQRSLKLAGRQPELLGQLAQATYFADGRKWSAGLQAITDEALAGDPNEATSLGLLGVAAFESKRYQEAADYWQRLLAILPADDASRQALQGGIDKARANLGPADANASSPVAAKLDVHVQLGDALKGKVQPGDSVFIFARAVSGPPMPLAVKRLTVADLPADVTLSDSDAMMPALKLSAFAQVQLMARISRAGTPTAGEWVARGSPLSTQANAAQTLVIDSPDQP